MSRLPRFPVKLPPSGVALVVLCALYLLPGLIGHDPWKSDDAVHFGITYGFLTGGHWLVPHLAGQPALHRPPLYYWLAVACVRLFGWAMPTYDAARLASGLCGAMYFAFLAAAARRLHGPWEAKAAVLVAMGCLGLLVPMHNMQPQLGLLAASAGFYAGLAILREQPLAGGLQAGLGLGLAFLCVGMTALITLAPVLILLPAIQHWRADPARRGWLVAIVTALPLVALWPLLLAWLAPKALAGWWATDQLQFHADSLQSLSDQAELLAWFTWPALPLALWALWFHRRRLAEPQLALPLLGTATTLLALIFLYEPRPVQALPVLVPMALLAAAGAGRLRRGAANALDWFGMMTFTLVAGLIWLGGIALNFGIPPKVLHNFLKLEPGFVAHRSIIALTIATLLTLAWFWLIFASPRSPWRAISHWAAGVTLVWVLVITFLLPWIDYGKSYRGVVHALERAMPAGVRCIAGRGLGGAQRASLQYFAGIITLPAHSKAAAACPLLIVQTTVQDHAALAGWHELWESHRPGDPDERLRLYRRVD